MLHIRALLTILAFLGAAAITSSVFAQSTITTPPTDKLNTASEPSPSFYSNEVVFKLSDEVAAPLQFDNTHKTGNSDLDTLFQKYAITKFSPVVTPTKYSSPDADIFRWYYITTAADPKLVYGTYQGSGIFDIQRSEIDLSQLANLLSELAQVPGVEVVEPHYQPQPLFIPNDLLYSTSELIPQYGNMWWLHQIQPEQAWERVNNVAQKPEVVIAVIDTGLDVLHPDIVNQIYHNPNEIANNGVDDDHNGHIDDVTGWDFGNNDNNPSDDAAPYSGHGTMVAGVVGAQMDNDINHDVTLGTSLVGVSGLSNIKILPLKMYHGSTDNPNSCIDALTCSIVYATDIEAQVANISSTVVGTLYDDAVMYAHDSGMVITIAGGNTNRDISLDQRPSYGIIVSRSGFNDGVLTNTNWGEQVDVAAPGDWILSLKNSLNSGGYYNYYAITSGTSFTAPQVAGLSGLLLTINPSLTNEQIRQIIRLSADDIGNPGKDYNFGYGRINVSRASELAEQVQQGTLTPLTPMIRTPRAYKSIQPGVFNVVGDVAYGQAAIPTDFTEYQLELGLGSTPATWETIGQGSSPIQNGVLGQYNSLHMPEGISTLRLTTRSTTHDYQYTRYIKADNLATMIDCPSPVYIGSISNCTGYAMSRDRTNIVFDHFIIEYRITNSTDAWQTAGVTLVGNGLSEVEGNYVGSIDTSYLQPDKSYSVRIRNFSTYGFEEIATDTFLTYPLPVSVIIENFSARAAKSGVVLDWNTVSEVEIQGFTIYRKSNNADKDSPEANWQQINKELIPASNPGGTTGATYSFLDEGRPSGQYDYALEVVNQNGSTVRDWFSSITY